MRKYPFLTTAQWLLVFRVLVGLMMVAHGAIRLINYSLPGFGEFLDEQGFHPGFVIAWIITLGDVILGLLFAAGIFHRWISLWFIGLMISGIILVHGKNGWFVVGHQIGGIEFNVLLIFCFLLLASTSAKRSNS